MLWKNSKWLLQKPFPNLRPIKLSGVTYLLPLRRLAELTTVETGDEIPDGYPNSVLKALQEAIDYDCNQNHGLPSENWSEKRIIPYALEILEKELEKSSPKRSEMMKKRKEVINEPQEIEELDEEEIPLSERRLRLALMSTEEVCDSKGPFYSQKEGVEILAYHQDEDIDEDNAPFYPSPAPPLPQEIVPSSRHSTGFNGEINDQRLDWEMRREMEVVEGRRARSLA